MFPKFRFRNPVNQQSRFHWSDLYHWLLTIPWWQFLSLISLLYLIINVVFACAYLAGGEGAIANARPHSWLDAFAFSVQTMATIGYGAMYPKSLYAHILVAIEVLLGLLSLAMATSLMFARFSRPTARVLFSRVAIITHYNGIPTLMFRVANQRSHWIIEAQVRVSALLPMETTPEGHTLRRLYDLSLVRSQTPLLTLTWTVMHPIDIHSPLYGIDQANWQQQGLELIVSLTGLDETLSQTIHARYRYTKDDLAWNRRFVDIVNTTPTGDRYLDYTHFHDLI